MCWDTRVTQSGDRRHMPGPRALLPPAPSKPQLPTYNIASFPPSAWTSKHCHKIHTPCRKKKEMKMPKIRSALSALTPSLCELRPHLPACREGQDRPPSGQCSDQGFSPQESTPTQNSHTYTTQSARPREIHLIFFFG